MPREERKQQTANQMFSTVKVLNAALGGKIQED